MNDFNQIYSAMIFEEVLTSANLIKDIKDLPMPFAEYLENMRQEMTKSLDKDASLTDVNSNVNLWRNKIILAFKRNKKSLTTSDVEKINAILMKLVNDFIEFMGGTNSGY